MRVGVMEKEAEGDQRHIQLQRRNEGLNSMVWDLNQIEGLLVHLNKLLRDLDNRNMLSAFRFLLGQVMHKILYKVHLPVCLLLMPMAVKTSNVEHVTW